MKRETKKREKTFVECFKMSRLFAPSHHYLHSERQMTPNYCQLLPHFCRIAFRADIQRLAKRITRVISLQNRHRLISLRPYGWLTITVVRVNYDKCFSILKLVQKDNTSCMSPSYSVLPFNRITLF